MLMFILLCLLVIAVLYGVFFLLFKLLFLLCKSKRNFWPLILSGICTLLLLLLMAIAAYQTYQHFAKPIMPIVQAATERTEPIYGETLYTDPLYGFTMTLHDGMTVGDWITLPTSSVLIGIDVNIFLLQDKTQQDQLPVSGFALVRIPQTTPMTARQAADALLQRLQQIPAEQGQFILTQDPKPINVGYQADGLLVTGTLKTATSDQDWPVTLIIATHDQAMYALVGLSKSAEQALSDTLLSFRFVQPKH